jgi:phosphate transport system protein
MRTGFHQELDALTESAAASCFSAGELLEQATTALIAADLAMARAAVGRRDELHRSLVDMEEAAVRLLALQAPVARDLRRVVSGLWTVGELRRMVALAGHVAEAVTRRHPRAVVPIELQAGFARMGQVGGQLADQVGRALLDGDPDRAGAVEALDDEIDRLHQHMFTLWPAPGWRHGVGPAIDTALLSRFYERFADHAVSIGRRVVFQETGDRSPPAPVPAGSPAPRPDPLSFVTRRRGTGRSTSRAG